MQQVSIDLNEVYEDKSSFYRKLDDLCSTINQFKTLQDQLFRTQSSHEHQEYSDI